MKNKKIRIARPSSDLQSTMKFYCEGLGLEKLGGFDDHEGFDGIMLGHKDQPYHLEFTSHRIQKIIPSPTSEDLLVFYIPNSEEWQSIVSKMELKGFSSVQSHNPYWDNVGKTFEDPDGYRIVIQNTDWEGVL